MSTDLFSRRKSFVELLSSTVSAYLVDQALKAICPQRKLTSLLVETLSNL
jgi:hypothetical protein